VFTAWYALSPYIKQIRFVFKGLIRSFLGSSWNSNSSMIADTDTVFRASWDTVIDKTRPLINEAVFNASYFLVFRRRALLGDFFKKRNCRVMQKIRYVKVINSYIQILSKIQNWAITFLGSECDSKSRSMLLSDCNTRMLGPAVCRVGVRESISYRLSSSPLGRSNYSVHLVANNMKCNKSGSYFNTHRMWVLLAKVAWVETVCRISVWGKESQTQ
jgi:hypothetical protein